MLHAEMPRDALPDWNRDADLRMIEEAYRGYDREGRGRLWSHSNEGYRRTALERNSEILALLSEGVRRVGPRVLDVGCGKGELAGEAKEAGLACEWIGVDLRAEVVREAARNHPWAGFMHSSADRMPLDAGSIDVALAIVLFSSLPSEALEAAVAQELNRVVRPGGWLIWFDIRYSNPFNRSVHGVSEERLRALFPGWDIESRTTSLMPPIARRLGRLTPVLYPLLRSITPFRSHLIGRLQRPPQGPSPI